MISTPFLGWVGNENTLQVAPLLKQMSDELAHYSSFRSFHCHCCWSGSTSTCRHLRKSQFARPLLYTQRVFGTYHGVTGGVIRPEGRANESQFLYQIYWVAFWNKIAVIKWEFCKQQNVSSGSCFTGWVVIAQYSRKEKTPVYSVTPSLLFYRVPVISFEK